MPHQTALHGAAERGFTPFVKFLAENGADLQAKDANGRTALDLAKGVGVAGVKSADARAVPGHRRPARIADGRQGHPAAGFREVAAGPLSGPQTRGRPERPHYTCLSEVELRADLEEPRRHDRQRVEIRRPVGLVEHLRRVRVEQVEDVER